MPGLHSYLVACGKVDSNETPGPEFTKIYLPSSISIDDRHLVCSSSLADIKDRLRYAQAMEALAGLHRHLRTQIMASKLNNRNASSQRSYVRSEALQNQVEVRVRACQRQYNFTRSAVLALRGPGDWETTLAELKPEDIRGISECALTEEERQEHQAACRMAGLSPADDIGDQRAFPVAPINPRLALGEGRRKLSWIWYTVSEGELNDGKVEESEEVPFFLAIATHPWTGLRVEWLKQHARAHRWREELKRRCGDRWRSVYGGRSGGLPVPAIRRASRRI